MSGCVDGLTVFRIYSFTHQRLYEMRNAACEFYTAPDYLAESFLTAYCVWDPTAEQDQQVGSTDVLSAIREELQNHDLVDELAADLPGIFNWAYDGLRMLRQAGRFIMPAKCKAAIQQYRTDVNPARKFLQDNYVAGHQYDDLPCGEIYRVYVQWCLDNGYRPTNNTNLGREVRRAVPDVRNIHKRRDERQVLIMWP